MSYSLANKLKLVGFSKSSVNVDKFAGFEGTLRAGIINQYAEKHLTDMKVPTTIVYGVADPFIINKNLVKLAHINPNIEVKSTLGGHAVRKRTLKVILESIKT